MINFTALPSGKMQREIYPGDKHKQYSDTLNSWAVEKRHAGIVGRKPTDRDGWKAVCYGIKTRHARCPVSGRAGECQAYVDRP